MSVVSVKARSFILALFIRDDGERFLLGDNGYDFKDSQLHFAANTIENDEVQIQGADGVLVAGQVRRASVQSFDGYVGDAALAKDVIEQMRRDFFAFFVKGHHFRVIYIDCNRNAWQRKGGYLVDAPEVKELWQIHPEYHVGLNFEDVNYYSYDEDAEGEEILANLLNVPVSSEVGGGLKWDGNGAVSGDDFVGETRTVSGKNLNITDAVIAPVADYKIYGDTLQSGTPTPSSPVAVQTVTGENTLQIIGKNLCDKSTIVAGDIIGGYTTIRLSTRQKYWLKAGTYTFSTNLPSPFQYGIQIQNVGVPPLSAYPTYIYDSTWRSAASFTFTTSQDGWLLFGFRRSDNSAITPSDISGYEIQLELGSTATDYEPYQGQSYEINLGKNLIRQIQDYSSDGLIFSTKQDGTTHIQGTSTSQVVNDTDISDIVLNPGTYTFSYSYNGTQPPVNSGAIQLRKYDPETETGTTIVALNAWANSSATFTLTEMTKLQRLRIFFNSGQSINCDVSVQLEKGSTASSFAAYFAPIELCKIGSYQDYVYKSGNKWYIHNAIRCQDYTGADGENWVAVNNRIELRNGDVMNGSSTNNPVVCNYFEAKWGGEDSIFCSGADNKVCIIDADDFGSNLTTFKTWIATHPLKIAYALATPTNTEITNAALVAQLEGALSAQTYDDANNVSLTPTANLQGSLEFTYYITYQPGDSDGYIWEEGGSGGPTTLINDSIDNVYPVWTIYGPVSNPALENTTTGEEIEYVGQITEGQTLVIDMGAQTALLDGMNVLSNLVGEFVSLAPGKNVLIYSASGGSKDSVIGWSEIVG